MMRTWMALAVVALGGCDLYFNGDDDPPCQYGGTGAVAPAQQVFDPYSGTCIYQGGWEGCDSSCGPCAEGAVNDGGGATWANMGACYSDCTGLTEQSCLTTAGCYAEYDTGGDSTAFAACWQVPPGGAIGGSCQGLDAYSCSMHDDCAISYDVSGGYKKFNACIDEPGYTHTCESTDCGPGYHCEDQCYPSDDPSGPSMGYCTAACVPDGSACTNVDCGPGYQCVDSCDGTGPGMTLWCGPQCVPAGGGDPGSCTGSVACDALPPSCPSGTTAGIVNGCWSGYCIPNNDCGPHDPGQCNGDITCTDKGPPLCPSGTTAGIANGCYTGYCIPNTQCTAAPCETLTTESACAGRMDCSPVYTGTSCTCDANGCTCSNLTFARCEAWWL